MSKTIFTFLLVISAIFLLSNAAHAQSNDNSYTQDYTEDSLINQLASQNIAGSGSSLGADFNKLSTGWANDSNPNNVYQGIKQFWYQEIFGNFFSNIGRSINNFFDSVRFGWIPNTIGYLCGVLQTFFLNTDLSQINSTSSYDFAYLINNLTSTIHGIAIDLSLLLFVLSIWHYWTQSSWHGNGSSLSAVARLIFAIGTIIAWPKIYSFEIELSNEMISSLFADHTGQITLLDVSISSIFTTGFSLAGAQSLASAPLPLINSIATLAQPVYSWLSIIVPIIVCLLGILLIYQLMYILVLKAIQTALMTAQYVFAPFFLVFLCNPITDNIATGYLRTFVEVSLWNFVWIGLLKILVISLHSNNPWGNLLTVIGILQIMIDVPQFLAHAKISVASDFVNPHFFVKLLKDVSQYDQKIKEGTGKIRDLITGHTREKTATESTVPDITAKTSDFSFPANIDNNIDRRNSLQLPPKNSKNNGNPDPANNPNNSGNTTSNSSGFFAFADAGARTQTYSSNARMDAVTGSAIAISASNSMATASALSIANATIINTSPGPSQSGSGPHTDPGPNPGSKPGPGLDPSPGFEPRLNLRLGPNSGPDPNLGLGPSPRSGPKPGPKPRPNSGGTLELDTNSNKNLESNNGSYLIANTSPGLINLPSPKSAPKPGPSSTLRLNLTDSASIHHASTRQSVDPSPNNVNESPLNISQIYNLNSLINYRLLKRENSSAKQYPKFDFYRSKRLYGTAETINVLRFYDLIFSHGNFPTIMGIPPIYPEVNKI